MTLRVLHDDANMMMLMTMMIMMMMTMMMMIGGGVGARADAMRLWH